MKEIKNREVREFQFSSSQLAAVFLGILILGIVIFLLGISIGKKHTLFSQGEKPVKESALKETSLPTVLAAEEPKTSSTSTSREEIISPEKRTIAQELESHQKAIPPPKKTMFYVQVGAFTSREAASNYARRFQSLGYPAIVIDPLPQDKKEVYRVRIGGFPTQAKAEQIKSEIRTKSLRKDCFVVKD